MPTPPALPRADRARLCVSHAGRLRRRPAVEALEGRALLAGSVTSFPVPLTGTAPRLIDITGGPDGNLWFTGETGDRTANGLVGRITPEGDVRLFSLTLPDLPDATLTPGPITNGPDGALWFVENVTVTDATGSHALTSRVGRIATTGAATQFTLPEGSRPGGITSGPDGNVWLNDAHPLRAGDPSVFGTLDHGNYTYYPDNIPRVERITPLGVVTQFPLAIEGPKADSFQNGAHDYSFNVAGAITKGPDGNLWFCQTVVRQSQNDGPVLTYDSGYVGRITPSGAITLFPADSTLPADDQAHESITAGPGGALWYAGSFGPGTRGGFGKISTSGQSSPVGDGTIIVNNIAAGADGNLYLSLHSPGTNLLRVSPQGDYAPLGHFDSPGAIAPGPDGNVWFLDGLHIARLNIAVAHPVVLPAPEVRSVVRHGAGRHPSRLVVAFDQALDAPTAGDRLNYRITPTDRFGRALGRSFHATGAVYDPSLATVTLSLPRHLALGRYYRLTVRGSGAGGVKGGDGEALRAPAPGRPGADATFYLHGFHVKGTPPRPARHSATDSPSGYLYVYPNPDGSLFPARPGHPYVFARAFPQKPGGEAPGPSQAR